MGLGNIQGSCTKSFKMKSQTDFTNKNRRSEKCPLLHLIGVSLSSAAPIRMALDFDILDHCSHAICWYYPCLQGPLLVRW